MAGVEHYQGDLKMGGRSRNSKSVCAAGFRAGTDDRPGAVVRTLRPHHP